MFWDSNTQASQGGYCSCVPFQIKLSQCSLVLTVFLIYSLFNISSYTYHQYPVSRKICRGLVVSAFLKTGSQSLVPYNIYPLFPCFPKPQGDLPREIKETDVGSQWYNTGHFFFDLDILYINNQLLKIPKSLYLNK